MTTAAGGDMVVRRISATVATMLDGIRTTSLNANRQSRSRNTIQIAAMTAGITDTISGEGSTVTIASDAASVIDVSKIVWWRAPPPAMNRAANIRAIKTAAMVSATTKKMCCCGPRASRLCADMNPPT